MTPPSLLLDTPMENMDHWELLPIYLRILQEKGEDISSFLDILAGQDS